MPGKRSNVQSWARRGRIVNRITHSYFGCIFQVRELLPEAKNKKDDMINNIIAGSIGGTV